MSRYKEWRIILPAGLLILVLGSLFTNMLLSFAYAQQQYRAAAGLIGRLIEEYPGEEDRIMNCVKEYADTPGVTGNDPLARYGYHWMDFGGPFRMNVVLTSVGIVLLLSSLLVLVASAMRTGVRLRVQAITERLVQVNSGKYLAVSPVVEDDFSVLEDELSKTLSELKIARERALADKQNYADSLADIAHQIKTPATAMSLTMQRLSGDIPGSELAKIRTQLDKIGRLTDALLTVSKIDAGILALKQEPVDVYTMLTLAVEALEDQIRSRQMEVDLPNNPEVMFTGDLDWSVEVFVNLIKNCLEHMPDHGLLTFQYAHNPLYIEISVKDNGEGFDEQQIPYLFERFYRGHPEVTGGTGIGLSIARSIIEMQNGSVIARNLPGGGACFEVRFYCH